MNTATIIAIALAVVAVGFGAFMFLQKEKTKRLQTKFGPEYDRLIDRYGNQQKAETDLLNRERRVEKLKIRDLEPAEAEHFATAWRDEQAHFVDNPNEAVTNADKLVGELMAACGYPVGDFEQRAADVSVSHPLVVEHYRSGHSIADRNANGHASTEDLRQAMVHYRALFDDLLQRHVKKADEVKRSEEIKI